MDRLTASIAIAHLRLRLDALCFFPHLLRDLEMPLDIKRPMELAAMKGRLARAQLAETRIADVGKRFDTVLDKIDNLTNSAEDHAKSLEQYSGDLERMIEGMVGGSNGGPTVGAAGPVTSGPGAASAVDIPAAEPAASWARKS